MDRSIIRERKRTSHGLHLALTILTGGIWGLMIWWPLTIWHKLGPRQRTVIEHRGGYPSASTPASELSPPPASVTYL